MSPRPLLLLSVLASLAVLPAVGPIGAPSTTAVVSTPRSIQSASFGAQWSVVNADDPEEMDVLNWALSSNGPSTNLTQASVPGSCNLGDVEYFGNSWAPPDPQSGGIVLVGAGTTGVGTAPWGPTSSGEGIEIHSISNSCPNSANVPVVTKYRFGDLGAASNEITVERTFDFAGHPFDKSFRPFIPRLYPASNSSLVYYPSTGGAFASVGVASCPAGCTGPAITGTGASSLSVAWDASAGWFAIHDVTNNQGVIVRRGNGGPTAQLWVDYDGVSNTNSSSLLLMAPSGGFNTQVTDVEVLCFYQSSSPQSAAYWSPSLQLPAACALPPPAWRFPWAYDTSWYFNGGPHSWAGSAGSGLDFAPVANNAVYAAAKGHVYFIGTTPTICQDSVDSNVVKIRHDGGWETWYLHLASFHPNWPIGAVDIPVESGAYLGETGSTGACGSFHLHIELCGGLPDGTYCPEATQNYHHTWDGQVIDEWTVHQDCGNPPVQGCANTNYNGYMSMGSTTRVPCVPTIAHPCTRVTVGDSHNPTPGGSLAVPSPAGSSILQIPDVSIYSLADRIRINPGGATQEDRIITGFGSLILDSPLQFDHGTGEPVAVVSTSSVAVGGIAEQPELTALPSAAESSGRDYTIYVLGGAVAFVVASAGAAGWRKRRA